MNGQKSGFFLLGLSLLTLCLVLMIGQLARTIKEAAWFIKNGGSIEYTTVFQEVPFAVFILIILAIGVSLYMLMRNGKTR